MAETPQDIIKLIQEQDIEFVDFRFTDLPGLQQHFAVPARTVDEGMFANGLGFDGSSIRGFQQIHESDMLLIPDPKTSFVDPFTEHMTLNMLCNVQDPLTREWYSRDPRYVCQKAETYLKSTGIADQAFYGPEAEFFLFDSVRYSTEPWNTGFQITSREAHWASGEATVPGTGEASWGYKMRNKEGYFPLQPSDQINDARAEMVRKMLDNGNNIELHHRVAARSGRIDIRFDTMRDGDDLLNYKLHHQEHGPRVGWSRPSCRSRLRRNGSACTPTCRTGKRSTPLDARAYSR